MVLTGDHCVFSSRAAKQTKRIVQRLVQQNKQRASVQSCLLATRTQTAIEAESSTPTYDLKTLFTAASVCLQVQAGEDAEFCKTLP